MARMSSSSQQRSAEFLKIAGQFKLGALVTESSHPVTANLSAVAKQDVAAALKLLLDVDDDVVKKFREFAASSRAGEVAATVRAAVQNGGRIFFTGCGSTGRLSILLDSVWRDFWKQPTESGKRKTEGGDDFENRSFSVMAGGDYALIKSVEGFEDFTAFGKKQINDLGVSAKDVVFAITEGGETSFVIGTAWAGVEAGAKVYFVYNNPDEILCEHVERSREDVPQRFLAKLEELHATLKSPAVLAQLAKLVVLEETVYRAGHKINYLAKNLGIDVLTDTTERSPTFCTPPFRKADDTKAAASWAFLFLPQMETPLAWRHILKREPRCVEWTEAEVRALVGDEKFPRTLETVRKISATELMRFKIGWHDMPLRPLGDGDGAVAILSTHGKADTLSAGGFFRLQLEAARRAGAKTGLVFFGRGEALDLARSFAAEAGPDCVSVVVPVPETDLLLGGVKRVGVKLLLNALSTCTMVRLGRVMGNYMVWVVPSNLKLIDRATRYISKLTDLSYDRANELLFEVIEYVEPRMKADQAYPPVVGVAVLRAKNNLTNEAAEKKLGAET